MNIFISYLLSFFVKHNIQLIWSQNYKENELNYIFLLYIHQCGLSTVTWQSTYFYISYIFIYYRYILLAAVISVVWAEGEGDRNWQHERMNERVASNVLVKVNSSSKNTKNTRTQISCVRKETHFTFTLKLGCTSWQLENRYYVIRMSVNCETQTGRSGQEVQSDSNLGVR